MKEYKVLNDYLYFREMFSDTIGMNYHVAPILNRKPVGHKVLCEVNPSIFGHAEIWKRTKILLEGIKKANIPFLYSPEKIIINDKQCQLVFEHFRGKNIEQILSDAEKKGLPINFDLALSICISIADIIELGSSIIVSGEKSFHGFLTPDNIMVNYDGKIALKNYGIFPYLERNETLFTELEKRYGSWLTPELIRKEKIVSQSDIYHLGYLIYRILMGKYFSCIPGEDFDAKFINLTFNQVIPSTDKNFLTQLIIFFKKTLNPNPLKRFLTIKELKDFIANYFHIEELSSITFNLAYFMNSLYGESIEEEEKLCKQELAYFIPEPKKEPVSPPPLQIKREDLVSGILDELDKRKKFPTWIWAVVVIVVVGGAGAGYFYLSQTKKTETLTAAKVKSEEQQRQKQQEELANLIKNQNEKILQLELLAATATEAQKRTLELEKQRLEDMKKKKDDDLAKQKTDEETRKKLEAEQAQKDLDAKKVLEDLDKKNQEEERLKNEEIENKRLEMAKIKEGDTVALGEVTVKPEKISGSAPSFNSSMTNKYKGRVITVQTLILVDENGDVTKIKILTPNVASDIKALLEYTLFKYKYKPALKDTIKVKVWLTVPVKFTF